MTRNTTAQLWARQDKAVGDREPLYRAVAESDVVDARTVLYPGSYVDLAPSFVFPSVTYVDVDKRANRFFGDRDGVRAIVASRRGSPPDSRITFLHADYTTPLDLPEGHFDLLISVYAGFVSEHCTQHLRVGGTLLVNSSHGDAAMAGLDPRLELAAVVTSRAGAHRVDASDLDRWMVARKDVEVSADLLHETGRGIAYTRSPFAYLFTRVA
ncbi:MAG TPA: hypothetical protein VJ978_02190 [Nitriliruptoraceae bacterium]|nr:hypothetical protein [Nitriliruptoraceae bacterium]